MAEQINEARAEEVLNEWADLAYRDCRTDAAVNDLLEEVAGPKYLDNDISDNPIWETIQSLSEEEADAFMSGCGRIRERYIG